MINGKIIKVCGMREAENIQDVESIEGIDMLGFIFYPKSPRYVYELPAYLPIHARRVGVFVNEDKQTISMYADRFGLNYVQLHGNESPEYCRSLHSTGLKIIKAFSVDRPKDLRKVYDYEKVCGGVEAISMSRLTMWESLMRGDTTASQAFMLHPWKDVRKGPEDQRHLVRHDLP